MMNDVISGLLLGAGFGFVLERAGFGSPCKLTAQFRLTDWSVFKVMFTAIVFAAVGLMALERLGVLQTDDLFVPPALLGAVAIGGALVGIGFAVGGYCPGTSVVAFVSGRIDAAIFLVGLLLGTWVFAWLFSNFEPITVLGEYTLADTLPEAFHVSDITVNIILVLAAIGVFALGTAMEKRSCGPVTAQEAMKVTSISTNQKS